jgi:hypothetical protein
MRSGGNTTVMRILILALIAAPIGAVSTLALPSAANAQQVERKLIIYGNDPCPADTICVTAPEEERFRIPKPLRQGLPNPENQSWAVRSQDTLTVGQSGIGSCTNSGGGGWTGCFQKQMQEARREREEAEANARAIP